ncbi:MAG: NUDIX domain-containing protein [Paludibacteraceae bacterium]
MNDYQLTSDGLYAYRYPRASVTADSVLFAEKDGQVYVLLIQRGNEPYKGYWAFPGGFLNMDETVARCAERELEEETGIVMSGMQLVGVYSDVERDPRGRVITAAYTAMTTMPKAKAADDAAAAHWFQLDSLPPLAFDHALILQDAMRVLNIDIEKRCKP